MKIQYSPKFAKQFKKLSKEIQKSALKSEKLFRENPFNPKLKTHKLHGAMKDYWAFSISYSHRIGFTFNDRDFVTFDAIGSHDIYK